MFRTVPLSIIRSFSLYTQQWYMSYRFADSLRAGSGRLYTQQWYMSYRFADSLRAGSGRLHTQQWYMSYRFADSLRAGSARLYTQQWYMSYRFADSLRSAGSGRASAYFVIPHCRVGFVQFSFGVPILICFLCLLCIDAWSSERQDHCYLWEYL